MDTLAYLVLLVQRVPRGTSPVIMARERRAPRVTLVYRAPPGPLRPSPSTADLASLSTKEPRGTQGTEDRLVFQVDLDLLGRSVILVSWERRGSQGYQASGVLLG